MHAPKQALPRDQAGNDPAESADERGMQKGRLERREQRGHEHRKEDGQREPARSHESLVALSL